MSRKALIEAHDWFYNQRGFVWMSDIERLGKLEDWEILRGDEGPFYGDCEDACLTIMNRLLEDDVDSVIVRCATEVCPRNKLFDHAVLAVPVDGRWYYSDNRFPRHPGASRLPGYIFYDHVTIENIRGKGKPELFK